MSFSSWFTNFLGIFLIFLLGGIGLGGAGLFFLLHLNSFDGFSTYDEETSFDGLAIVAVIFELASDLIVEASVNNLEKSIHILMLKSNSILLLLDRECKL